MGGSAVLYLSDVALDFLNVGGRPLGRDALPERTIDVLNNTDCALFGAITSLPKEECEAALVPELQGKGLVYRSPIVRLRQEFTAMVSVRNAIF